MEDSRTDEDIREENGFNVLPDGQKRFAKGNKYGSFPRELTIKHLTKLFREEEKQNPDKETILQHYKKRLFKSDILLSKFIDKYIPTINKQEVTGADGTPIKYIIEKTYEGEKEEVK